MQPFSSKGELNNCCYPVLIPIVPPITAPGASPRYAPIAAPATAGARLAIVFEFESDIWWCLSLLPEMEKLCHTSPA